MTKNVKWLILAAALAVALSGCGAGAGTNDSNGQEGNGSVEQPKAEAPAEEPAKEPAKEPVKETPAEEPKELGVDTGAAVEIETSIEGMKEKVNVTEYTLTPYGIQYQLRTDMGEPAVENGQVVYKTQMGDEVATIAMEVHEGMKVDEAVAEAQKKFATGYEPAELIDVPANDFPFGGKLQGFQKDGYLHGFHVFDVDGTTLVVYHSYPADAGDGMGAVFHEFMKSLKQ